MGDSLRKISRLFCLLAALTLLLLGGCYNKPVRHLAADVAMIKEGKSTQEDVLIFLGDPDDQADAGGGVVKWLYKETDRTLFERTPFVGKHIGSPEYKNVVVTFTNGVVSDTAYTASDEDDMDWADDYSWQEK
jgi:hypothetical protein